MYEIKRKKKVGLKQYLHSDKYILSKSLVGGGMVEEIYMHNLYINSMKSRVVSGYRSARHLQPEEHNNM